MVGTTLNHYEIVEKIGEGGMGQVYRARDGRLKREIAIKVLPAEMAGDPARLERFQREAETVAALTNPHIVHLYSLEEVDGVHFLTMELVQGHSLDRMLSPEGLPVPKVLEIGIGVADALSAAHERGVVHRDIKPGNVMVASDGWIKVLDFGLAKLAESPNGADATTEVLPITREGTVLGTVPYMSPEQFRGQELDHRSDIFSLGIVLHELASGRRPFVGASSSDVGSAILRDAPPPLAQLKPDLPPHLGHIVARCLEKEPDRRLQNAKDLRNELAHLRDETRMGGAPQSVRSMSGIAASAAPGPSPLSETQSSGIQLLPPDRSIAVLPFVNMSSDPEQEYFSDGISEELLNLLAKIPELRVTSRSSAFSFKGKDLEVREIGRQLNVASVLEGSVRKAANRVRINAQLIDAGSDTHVWSETYDRTLDDIFAVQDEIAADVVENLKVTLLGDAPKVRKTHPEAYALFLQANELSSQLSAEGLEKAVELYHRVLALDPGYAEAWERLGTAYSNQAGSQLRPDYEGYPLSREMCNRALAIDPDLAAAHSGLAWIAMRYEGDLAAAARHLERALTLAPAHVSALNTASELCRQLGRLDESIAIAEYEVARDPASPVGHLNLGVTYLDVGRFDEAIRSVRSALKLSPSMVQAQAVIGAALLYQGKPAEALDMIRRDSDEKWRLTGLAVAHHDLGQTKESDAALAELIEKNEDDPQAIATVLAYRGDADGAFEWLEKAMERSRSGLSSIHLDIDFTNLHSDPRWLPLLRQLGRAPEQLAEIEFKVTLPES